MPQLVVINSLTLDGVMQAPGRPDEDHRDGFPHGGWAVPYGDDVMARVMGEGMAAPNVSLLLGRRTYKDFAGFWPKQTDNPFTPVLNARRKYVASTTLTGPLPWANSVLLDGDVAKAVAELKEQPGDDLVVLGSGELCRTLMQHDLVDAYTLLIHPLVLGTGRRLFTDPSAFARLRLDDCVPTNHRRPDRHLPPGGPLSGGKEGHPMKQYLLSIYQPDGDPPPPEVLEPIMRGLEALNREMQEAGAWVFAGGLHPPSTATVLRVHEVTCSPPTARSPRARSTSVASPSSGRPISTGPWSGAAGSPR